MAKLTDTQSIILSRAATRPGNLALPLPDGLQGAAAKKVVSLMIERGWLEEVDADIRRKELFWRETANGHGTTLIATVAGLEAVGIEPVVASAVTAARKSKPTPQTEAAATKTSDAPKPATPRAGTKQAVLVDMLRAESGASIDEIVAATGWQAHSIRGAMSGVLKKNLGLSVTSEKVEGRGRVYRIA